MNSLHDDSSRHAVVDGRSGHYLCFPDVAALSDGRLVAVYREADKHVADRRRILAKTSDNRGKSWDGPYMVHPSAGHCPRLAALGGDELAMVCDDPPFSCWSLDRGQTWSPSPMHGLGYGIPDRLLPVAPEELSGESSSGLQNAGILLTAGQDIRPVSPYPWLGQPPIDVGVFCTTNHGVNWRQRSLAASSRYLALCEPSMTKLPDSRLLLLMRENSMVFEPMYYCLSSDMGRTWTEPAPTPLIGHRPCLGLTRTGKLLVTYRDVSPASGVSAWLGDLDQWQDFQPHSLVWGELNLTGAYMDMHTEPDKPVLFALRPLSDPATARASLEAEVEAFGDGPGTVGLKLGVWWRIEPGRIVPCLPRSRPVAVPEGRSNRIHIDYNAGSLELRVNGQLRRRYAISAPQLAMRAVLWGSPPRTDKAPAHLCPAPEREGAAGPSRSRWRYLRLEINEPRFLREYAWEWSPGQGPPHRWQEQNILRLRENRKAGLGDFGYSGWAEPEPDSFVCVYHWADGEAPDYRRSYSSHVACTRFFPTDFS